MPNLPPPDELTTPAAGRWAERWHRYKHWVAVASFALGLASLLLLERQERVAQAMVVLLPLSWVLMLSEGWIERVALRRPRLHLSPLLLRYTMQALHQESFFFTLPFFIATTTWASGQSVFVGALGLAALVSMIDPLYYGQVVPRRSLYLGFHALAVFVTVLTAAPMLWQLTTAQSLQLAIACMGLVSVPSLAQALGTQGRTAWLALGAGVLLLCVAIWGGRGFIPPATLWVEESTVSQRLSVEEKAAIAIGDSFDAASVHREGIYVWTAIRAPRGLAERIEHRWLHEGVEVDRVALDILGGRAEGYRAWSHKRAFPADPRGAWKVEVRTEVGQLIGVVRFRVVAAP